ncbi:hypothetical protein SprV_0702266900 [Sparganum proliferum]
MRLPRIIPQAQDFEHQGSRALCRVGGPVAVVDSPMSRHSHKDQRRERAEIAGAAGPAPRRTATPGPGPTRLECHKGYIDERLTELES